MRPEDLDRLENILDAADRIAGYAAPGEGAFLAEPMRQDAIIRNPRSSARRSADSRPS